MAVSSGGLQSTVPFSPYFFFDSTYAVIPHVYPLQVPCMTEEFLSPIGRYIQFLSTACLTHRTSLLLSHPLISHTMQLSAQTLLFISRDPLGEEACPMEDATSSSQ